MKKEYPLRHLRANWPLIYSPAVSRRAIGEWKPFEGPAASWRLGEQLQAGLIDEETNRRRVADLVAWDSKGGAAPTWLEISEEFLYIPSNSFSLPKT